MRWPPSRSTPANSAASNSIAAPSSSPNSSSGSASSSHAASHRQGRYRRAPPPPKKATILQQDAVLVYDEIIARKNPPPAKISPSGTATPPSPAAARPRPRSGSPLARLRQKDPPANPTKHPNPGNPESVGPIPSIPRTTNPFRRRQNQSARGARQVPPMARAFGALFAAVSIFLGLKPQAVMRGAFGAAKVPGLRCEDTRFALR